MNFRVKSNTFLPILARKFKYFSNYIFKYLNFCAKNRQNIICLKYVANLTVKWEFLSIFSIKWKMMDISVLFSLTFSNFKNVKLWMHDKWSSRHTHLFCWTRKISFFFDVMSWVKKKFLEEGEHFQKGDYSAYLCYVGVFFDLSTG